MNIDLLETYIDLLECRNFNQTAERLGIAQSSVSARIANLEKLVGTSLFERGRHGAQPTPAGIRLEEHARILLASWYHACRDVAADSGHQRVLRLAGQLSLMRSVLVEWVIQLRNRETGQTIDLQADYSGQITRDVSMGVLDIALLYAPRTLPDLAIQQEGMETFRMVSTCAEDLQEVHSHAYVRANYTQYFNRVHDELLPELAGSSLSVGNEELAVALVSRLGGSTYVPCSMAQRLCAGAGNFCIVSKAPVIKQPIYSAIHVRRQRDPMVANALIVLRQVLTTSPGYTQAVK